MAGGGVGGGEGRGKARKTKSFVDSPLLSMIEVFWHGVSLMSSISKTNINKSLLVVGFGCVHLIKEGKSLPLDLEVSCCNASQLTVIQQ